MLLEAVGPRQKPCEDILYCSTVDNSMWWRYGKGEKQGSCRFAEGSFCPSPSLELPWAWLPEAVRVKCPNGISEVGTLLSAVSRDQPGHLESWADPPTQLEPRGDGEGDHASERPRRTTAHKTSRNPRTCTPRHGIEYRMVRCGMAGRAFGAIGEGL